MIKITNTHFTQCVLASAVMAVASTALAQNCVTATNPVHEYEGRATYYYYYGYQYNAVGSGEYIGNFYATTSLAQTAPNHWESVDNCELQPQAPTLSAVTVSVSDNEVTVSGSASDADNDLEKVVLQYNGTGAVEVTPNSSGNWNHVTSDHPTGENFTVKAKAVDAAGLESAWSNEQTYNVGVPQECNSADLDLAQIEAAVPYINANAPGLNSYIVRHCNQIVSENYFGEHNATMSHQLQSATKTISAILIGIAMDKGFIPNDLNTPLSDLLPDYAHLLTGSKAEITLWNVLTMTTGLSWNDFDVPSDFQKLKETVNTDSVEFILSRAHDSRYSKPKGQFFYNTGSSHLLSAIIHYNTPGTTLEFAEEHLFTPLGITGDYSWLTTLDGINAGGWDSFMLPRDFNKLGQMLLDEGQWQGQQIVSQTYVDQMTAAQVQKDSSASWYGFQMWIETDYGTQDLAGARGWGNQDTLVLENEDMVVTFTGDIDQTAASDNYAEVKKIMQDYVTPAHVVNGGSGGGGGNGGSCVTATNAEHESAGRAYSYSNYYYATGSAAYLGAGGGISVSLTQTASGYWQIAANGCD
ncbi:serine hydrolase [Pseudomaricurvus alkylphenolicus]|uniref:serine hydrolase domain-containing protein n=1 Tax=Pseudomaricurvus alkylphenolicus TaxID=1306991 RepID=UPI00141ED67F|nr:serine hydrolase [Pseudomaricurvus alkylphenolicus]NIB40558.1 serine hydrolase [Pseudomaricurvus alkylphenolicus]